MELKLWHPFSRLVVKTVDFYLLLYGKPSPPPYLPFLFPLTHTGNSCEHVIDWFIQIYDEKSSTNFIYRVLNEIQQFSFSAFFCCYKTTANILFEKEMLENV